MRSFTAYTGEIDDLDAAVEELFAQTRDFALAKNTMALLFTEEETDYPALYERLSQRWDFPVIGCTAMAMLTDKLGYCRGGISVLLLTADDCTFTIGATGELERPHFKEQLAQLCRDLNARHTGEAKLVLNYYAIPVTEEEMSGSNLLAVINEEMHGLPIYGGVASDDLDFMANCVFCNGSVIKTGVVMVLISGNISPRFVCVNSVERTAPFSYEITKSDGTIVRRLGGVSFVDALRKENMRTDQEDMMSAYILSPFVVSVDQGEGDYVRVARILARLDLTTGAGRFLSVMPEGATLGIGLVNCDDVCMTVERAFTRVLREIAQQEDCSTFLCNSCSARYLALINDPSVEAQTYLGRLPESVSLMGFYAYGECCPTRGERTGREYNMYHNFTFTILAM